MSKKWAERRLNEKKEVISFYLSKALIKDLDKSAESVHMNRSQFLEWLLTKSLPMAKKVAEMMDKAFQTVKKPEDVAT